MVRKSARICKKETELIELDTTKRLERLPNEIVTRRQTKNITKIKSKPIIKKNKKLASKRMPIKNVKKNSKKTICKRQTNKLSKISTPSIERNVISNNNKKTNIENSLDCLIHIAKEEKQSIDLLETKKMCKKETELIKLDKMKRSETSPNGVLSRRQALNATKTKSKPMINKNKKLALKRKPKKTLKKISKKIICKRKTRKLSKISTHSIGKKVNSTDNKKKCIENSLNNPIDLTKKEAIDVTNKDTDYIESTGIIQTANIIDNTIYSIDLCHSDIRMLDNAGIQTIDTCDVIEQIKSNHTSDSDLNLPVITNRRSSRVNEEIIQKTRSNSKQKKGETISNPSSSNACSVKSKSDLSYDEYKDCEHNIEINKDQGTNIESNHLKTSKMCEIPISDIVGGSNSLPNQLEINNEEMHSISKISSPIAKYNKDDSISHDIESNTEKSKTKQQNEVEIMFSQIPETQSYMENIDYANSSNNTYRNVKHFLEEYDLQVSTCTSSQTCTTDTEHRSMQTLSGTPPDSRIESMYTMISANIVKPSSNDSTHDSEESSTCRSEARIINNQMSFNEKLNICISQQDVVCKQHERVRTNIPAPLGHSNSILSRATRNLTAETTYYQNERERYQNKALFEGGEGSSEENNSAMDAHMKRARIDQLRRSGKFENEYIIKLRKENIKKEKDER